MVKVRIMGKDKDVQWFKQLLEELEMNECIEILNISKSYANRNDSGERVYIDLQKKENR